MKRGESGLSLVVGIDKPSGMTSHDVVDRVRRIMQERRVGHSGTLDPLATGVLPVLVGPATRLSDYLTSRDKRYAVRIAFGASTDTDDSQGSVVASCVPPASLLNRAFAESAVAGMIGASMQLPPAYSALKVGGKKACDEARAGRIIDLSPRSIEVFDAKLLFVGGDDVKGYAIWDVALHVSKGTYIRSIARDLGVSVGCPAHVCALRRIGSGALDALSCITLDDLASRVADGLPVALDPVPLLDYRAICPKGASLGRVSCGNALPLEDVMASGGLFDVNPSSGDACFSSMRETVEPPRDGELFSVVEPGLLDAVYRYDGSRRLFVPACVFSIGVSRG